MKKIVLPILMSTLMLCSCHNKQYDSLPVKTEYGEVNDTLDQVSNKKCHVVLLYGQSNATGVSLNEYLQKNDETKYNLYSQGFDNVYINYVTEDGGNSSNNTFIKCKLGCGASSLHYGPEIGIAEYYHSIYESEPTFIIKYSYGGTILHSQWLNTYQKENTLCKAATSLTKQSISYLKKKGYQVNIEGICWMQGESDAVVEDYYKYYYENTKTLVNYFRNNLKSIDNVTHKQTIPFVDALISDVWGIHYTDINDAKKKFAQEDQATSIIDTISLGLTTKNEPTNKPDTAHYDSSSMVILGNKFGEHLYNLNK